MKLVFACLCIGSNAVIDSDWESYKNEFGKVYNNDDNGENGVETEDVYRRGIFEHNLVLIADLNAQESLAHYGPTKFTDMKIEEYINGYKPDQQQVRHKLEVQPVALAAEVDWTGIYTTAIKDQGSCGSCWAESAISQVESDAMREHGFTGMLSVQQLVDCEGSGQGSWRGGCDGGSTTSGYKVLMSLGGVASAYEYKYTAKDMACNINNYNKYVQVVSHKYVGEDDENTMRSYVSSTGPLSVCVDAKSWGSYHNGIKTSCGTSVDHCVQIVGFGTQDSTDYWKVRNSWGDWGESGHIRLQFGRDLCKISSDATATSTEVLSTPSVPHATCTDKAWHSSEGDPCSTYELNSYCTADGREGEGWNSCSWGSLGPNYADSHGVTAFDACCGCGGGDRAPAPADSIQSTATGLCVDLPGGDTTNGNKIWMWECYGGETQQWSFQDNQLVYLPDTSKCVDLLGGDSSNGNQLGIWDCYGGDSQQWGFDSDYGTFYLASSGHDATKCAWSSDRGSPLAIWDCNLDSTQIWTLGSGESAESSFRASARTNATSASSCTDVSHWKSSEGDDCCKYPWESWCTADGQPGPGWQSSWGSISDYANSNGVSATDACCGCGGGSWSVVV